jgi:hypothetical protein
VVGLHVRRGDKAYITVKDLSSEETIEKRLARNRT